MVKGKVILPGCRYLRFLFCFDYVIAFLKRGYGLQNQSRIHLLLAWTTERKPKGGKQMEGENECGKTLK